MDHDEETAAVIGDALLDAGYDVDQKGRRIKVGKTEAFSFDDDEVVIERERSPGDVELLLKSVRLGRAVKIRGKMYDVHPLDVWGNEDDGFEINDVYPSRGKIEIPTRASDADIVRLLKEDGFIDKNVKPSNVEIGGDEYELLVSDAQNGQPVYQLRPG